MTYSSVSLAGLVGSALILLALVFPHIMQAGPYDAAGGPVPALTVISPPGAAVSYRQGWNIVAGPAGTVFAQANRILYTSQTNAGFTLLPNTDGVTQGWGYWAYFVSDTMVVMNGAGGDTYTTSVEPGQFKMVGNPSGTKRALVTADVIWTYDPHVGYKRNQDSAVLDVGRGAWAYSILGGSARVTAIDGTPGPAPSPTASPSATVGPPTTGTPAATMTPPPTATPAPTATVTPVAASLIRFSGATDLRRSIDFDVKPDLSAMTWLRFEYEVTCPDYSGFGWEEYRRPAHFAIEDGTFRIEIPAGGGRTDIFAGEFDATFTTAKGTWLKWLVLTFPEVSIAICPNSGTWTASRQP